METFECATPGHLEDMMAFGIFVHIVPDAVSQRLGERRTRLAGQRQRLLQDVFGVPFHGSILRGLLVEELPSDNRSRVKLTRDILRLLATLEFAQAKKRRGEHRLGSSGPPCS